MDYMQVKCYDIDNDTNVFVQAVRFVQSGKSHSLNVVLDEGGRDIVIATFDFLINEGKIMIGVYDRDEAEPVYTKEVKVNGCN